MNQRSITEAFQLVCTPSTFMIPQYQNISAWHEHVPFAFWLMESMRPTSFVELGTHYGVSYFSFCQAVKALDLGTRCYAVDSWRGDPHAGFYGEEVYKEVSSYNNDNYSSFSCLIRSSFDDALESFQGGEIDILHIDGNHTYESVRNDFEKWFPKLSSQSLVLFHDTNVRERDFGVFRLFNELKARYPYFEFLHGYGLGIIGTGSVIQEAARNLFECQSNLETYVTVANVFSRLGRACSEAAANKRNVAEIGALKERRDQLIEESATNKQQFHAVQLVASDAQQEVADLRAQNEAMKSEVAVLRAQGGAAQQEVADLRAQNEAMKSEVAVLRAQGGAAQQEVADLRAQNEAMKSEVAVLRAQSGAAQQEVADLRTQNEASACAKSALLQQLEDANAGAAEKIKEKEFILMEKINEIAALTNIIGDCQRENMLDRRNTKSDIYNVINVLMSGPISKLRIRKNARLLQEVGFVDREWYLKSYPDVDAVGMDPGVHFLLYGYKEGRSPNGR
ncbi:class I SAM-dependent methyltransferase [Rhizobiaceae bacterium BDR2-2]|uniref:Class I SAM-dependent methyltransferase n=1 Tax=Ectorhizobium quercum TaxID=2965071 RepID=A0AAE3MWJ6_9HYPH|nr:class I SAM-dependent methyltransferase [Ectorhizobium quercum]MCX8996199.1 class I SAM-dependent methyltransferase [Ectorhizobium quercum]